MSSQETSSTPSDGANSVSCRLYVVVATKAPVAIVFRRGPSKWWHVLKWKLKEPSVEPGAWFKGGLYPRRSNVSPDGKYMGYFAMKGNRIDSSWYQYFAVSKAPWMTALAAWKSLGTWTTGCRFGSKLDLTIAGVMDRYEPFHGSYPGKVCMEGFDMNWRQARFVHEFERGWAEDFSTDAKKFLELVSKRKKGLVLQKADKKTGGKLALVSRSEGAAIKYFYKSKDGKVTSMNDVAWADFDYRDRFLTATHSGQLQIRDARAGKMDVVWSQDLNGVEPNATPSPKWAQAW